MALSPLKRPDLPEAVQLVPFESCHAARVASWVCDAREAMWLAPHTPPPLTPECIRAWSLPDRFPFQLVAAAPPHPAQFESSAASWAEPAAAGDPAAGAGPCRDMAIPLAYGEVNLLDRRRREYWLGHLIVDPAQRGRGLGAALARLLARRAFGELSARRVTLVVFRENRSAIRSYRRAGFIDDGFETHAFPAYDRVEDLLRMRAPPMPHSP